MAGTAKLEPEMTPAGARIEIMDNQMVEILRRKTPAERLAIAFGLWRSARLILTGCLKSLHPEWDEAKVQQEVARRFLGGELSARIFLSSAPPR